MRCKTARDNYLRNRDGMLDEVERIKLQAHLDRCGRCAGFAGEMDRCLGLIGKLPDMELPDSFDWNVKRRIAMEKSRVMRVQAGGLFGGSYWGAKFVASAAAAMIIVLAGAWFVLQGGDSTGNSPVTLSDSGARSSRSDQGVISYTNKGYPAGIRMVSDDPFSGGSSRQSGRQMPFSMESERRMEYLMKENEVLRRYLRQYKQENAYLRRLIAEERSRR